jgi:hypothetical protein
LYADVLPSKPDGVNLYKYHWDNNTLINNNNKKIKADLIVLDWVQRGIRAGFSKLYGHLTLDGHSHGAAHRARMEVRKQPGAGSGRTTQSAPATFGTWWWGPCLVC